MTGPREQAREIVEAWWAANPTVDSRGSRDLVDRIAAALALPKNGGKPRERARKIATRWLDSVDVRRYIDWRAEQRLVRAVARALAEAQAGPPDVAPSSEAPDGDGRETREA